MSTIKVFSERVGNVAIKKQKRQRKQKDTATLVLGLGIRIKDQGLRRYRFEV